MADWEHYRNTGELCAHVGCVRVAVFRSHASPPVYACVQHAAQVIRRAREGR